MSKIKSNCFSQTFKQHESEVRSVRFHPFKNILLSASYDNTSVVTEFDTQGFYLSSSLQTSCYEKHKFILNVKLT